MRVRFLVALPLLMVSACASASEASLAPGGASSADAYSDLPSDAPASVTSTPVDDARDPCAFRAPEFYPDDDRMGSRFGPPDPPGGTGRLKSPAIRLVLTDPSVANRPYVVRAEVVHDSGLQHVTFGWNTNMERKWEYECGGPKPPGVQISCAQVGYVYVFVVVPPAGSHGFGVSARSVDGGSSGVSVATEFVRCPAR